MRSRYGPDLAFGPLTLGLVALEAHRDASTLSRLAAHDAELKGRALGRFDEALVAARPPFDARCLYVTLLLEPVRDKTPVVNDPHGLRDANEKLRQLHFPEVFPRALVASREG